MRCPRPSRLAAPILLATLGLAAPSLAAAALPTSCTGPAKVSGGQRRLALLVGVGDYAAVDKLTGPRNDVEAMARLLAKFGFPAENVCALVDGAATTAAFKDAFEQALVGRAKAGDTVLVYFSGHGSQVRDTNQDEPDGWDETILLQDARTPGVKDLVDDELNGMLARLYKKSDNLTVILDSCNSGTATRGVDAGTARVRFVAPEGAAAPREVGPTGGSRDVFLPADLPNAVMFTAAADGTSALEIDGRGVFTSALERVLTLPSRGPLTWAAVARRIPELVRAAQSPQVPYFQGRLDRVVFGVDTRPPPPSLDVKTVGPELELVGAPLPGMGVGAELRVYAAGLAPAIYGDPSASKGTATILAPYSGLNARARFVARAGGEAVQAGDVAVLVRPADDAIRISVRLRPSAAAGDGGLSAADVAAVQQAIAGDPDARTSVVLVGAQAGAFELSRQGDRFVLRGPENNVRNVIATLADVPRKLWGHARQRALLQLQPEPGRDFVPGESLQVRAIPAPPPPGGASACARRAAQGWVQAPANAPQVIPLCARWQLEVTLRASARRPVLVGGVILSSDGSTLGFPKDGQAVKLEPGKSMVLSGTYAGLLPLDTIDTVRVFGTQETNRVDWRLLTLDQASRGAAPRGDRGPLHGALERYMSGKRGVGDADEPVDDTTWTASSIELRVEANARFLAPASAKGAVRTKEYTIPEFDLRPYRTDPASALDRVLAKADDLAHLQVGYKQHDWTAKTEAENLKRGIDCSRAVWFAFTRAGLPYNQNTARDGKPPAASDYLTTAQMVGADTRMKDEFDACDPLDPLLGDLLVYRDDARGDGHVVMVIDPSRRIAWGSHGWDGTAQELKVKPATGVQYQLIKHKQDWERWDRKNMKAKACWRYRAFAKERASGLTPILALSPQAVCAEGSCPARGLAEPRDP